MYITRDQHTKQKKTMLKTQLAAVYNSTTSHIIEIVDFLIFTFNFDAMLLELYYREGILSQCLPPMFCVNLIATYISGVCIILTYNIDDLYHTGYGKDRSARYGKDRLYCMCMHSKLQ